MASIKKRENGKWRARYRDDTGKEHARHFERRIDAQRWLDQVTAAVVRGDYVDPKAGKVTVAAYAASWEAGQVSSEGTKRIVDNALRLHLLPVLGQRPIASVRTTEVQVSCATSRPRDWPRVRCGTSTTWPHRCCGCRR